MIWFGIVAMTLMVIMFVMALRMRATECGYEAHCGQCDEKEHGVYKHVGERKAALNAWAATHIHHKPVTVKTWEVF